MKEIAKYFFLFCFYQLSGSALVSVIMKVAGCKESANQEVLALVLASLLASVATLIHFFYARWCPVSMNYLSTRPYRFLTQCGILSLFLILPSAWFQELLPETLTKDYNKEFFEMLLKDARGYIIIGILAPLVEEVVFRGAILRHMLKWSREKGKGVRMEWMMIVGSALLFAIAHMNPAQTPHAFLIGILLGWLYWRTGSIVPGIVYHWVNNSFAFGIGYLFSDLPYDAKSEDYFQGDEQSTATAVVISLLFAAITIWKMRRVKSEE